VKIQCENCSVEHELEPPAWVASSGRPFRFRCSSCGHSQMVATATPAAPRPPPDEPSTAPNTDHPLFSQVVHNPTLMPASSHTTDSPEENSDSASSGAPNNPDGSPPVYLKQEGKVYLVRDWATVQRWIMERRVEREDLVSEGGVRWEPIGTRPELGSFFAAVEQLEAVEQTTTTTATAAPTPTPAPAAQPPPPFASASNPFPFGDPEADESESPTSRFARLDDDTEGVPMGLPPLPTDEVGGQGAGEYPDLPNIRKSALAAPSPTPDEVMRGSASPAQTPRMAAATPRAAPVPTIPPPALAPTPAPTPRVDTPHPKPPTWMPPKPARSEQVPPSMVQTMPMTPSPIPTAPAPAVTPHEEDKELAEDPFHGFKKAPAPATHDEWGDPVPVRGGLPPWLLPMVALVTVIFAVVIIGGIAIATLNGPKHPDIAHADEGGLQGVLPQPPPITPQPPLPPVVLPPTITVPTTPPPVTTPPVDATQPPTDATPPVADSHPPPVVPDEPPTRTNPTNPPTPPPATPKPPAPKVESASALIDKGWAAVDRGSLGSAASAFEKALAQAPGNADAQYGYGYVLLKQGDTDGAKTHLCKALSSAGASSDVARDVNGLLAGNGLSCH
jgi:outer membrane biosynthesis protein TonB